MQEFSTNSTIFYNQNVKNTSTNIYVTHYGIPSLMARNFSEIFSKAEREVCTDHFKTNRTVYNQSRRNISISS